ncbi:hypothetical protein MTR_2g084470 [Medicago truncatula]|uniref:Uncharacterized protein n=1 Tax=Medicago truncatula TaxID=3880 RepID=A0A072VBX9_MEDTR|nr:hypothetical protein MTR_2g084470 [Medicago truncatula]
MEFCPRHLRLKKFRLIEVISMLASFPTNVHKLLPDKDIPSYGRFSEKGSKTCKIRKLTSFPTNVHKLLPDKDIPSYGRFSEKGSKTSKIQKLTR